MNIFENIIAAPFREMLKSIVKNSGWALGDGTVGSVVYSVSSSPESLLGSGTWKNVLYWSNLVLTPIALMLVGIFMAIELYQLISKSNGNTDIEDLTKFAVRIIVPFFIATNATAFITNIMNLFNKMAVLLADKITNPDISSPGFEDIMTRIDTMNIGELLEAIIIYSVFGMVAQLVIPFILMFVVYGRLFEIVFLTFIAPIPMSSFLNDEWGSIGKQYLKYYASVLLQGVLIILACGISDALFSSTIIELGTYAGIIAWGTLCIVMLKTGRLAQRIMGI